MKNKIEGNHKIPRKEHALLDNEIIEKLRAQLADELEDLYTDPGFPVTDQELDSIKQIRSGQKIKATRILLDKIARIAGDSRIRYSIPELQKLYNAFTIGWENFVEIVEDKNKKMSIEELANELERLQQEKNNGNGVRVARSIVEWLRAGKILEAKSEASHDHDKISNYPDIEMLLKQQLFNGKDLWRWTPERDGNE